MIDPKLHGARAVSRDGMRMPLGAGKKAPATRIRCLPMALCCPLLLSEMPAHPV